MLAELGEPMLSTTLLLPDLELPLNDAGEIRDRLERQVELVIDGGPCGLTPTTVVDLTGSEPRLVRAGAGDLEQVGLVLAE